jgi:hypothetical protein
MIGSIVMDCPRFKTFEPDPPNPALAKGGEEEKSSY